MKKIETMFDRKYLNNRFSGSVIVSLKDDIILEKYYGFQDFENQTPINHLTKFDIGSITKGLTALVIMQLYEQKLIHVQHTIDHYIDYFPFGDQITIHQLLNHTSGLPSSSKHFDISVYSGYNKDQYHLNIVNKLRLAHPPGHSFLYSNFGYILLGYIIENVMGQRLKDVFKVNIFDHVGMKNSSFKNDVYKASNLAVGYKDYQYAVAELNYYDQKIGPRGSGGLCSTVLDLNNYLSSLLKGGLISKESLNMMMTPNGNYGYGWFVSDDFIEHHGNTMGYKSFIINRINDQLKVIILSNVQSTDMKTIGKSVKNIITS